VTYIVAHRALGVKKPCFGTEGIVINDIENDFETINNFVQNPYNDGVSDYIEVDVRCISGTLWVGHDEPEYPFPYQDWKESTQLIVHCKDIQSIKWLRQRTDHPAFDYFFHDQDDMVFTHKNRIWVHPHMLEVDPFAIPEGAFVVVPPNPKDAAIDTLNISRMIMKTWGGVCTDFPIEMDELLNES
jgi:hypothetical protein